MKKYFTRRLVVFMLAALFSIVAKAQVSPYARIEIDNFSEIVYGPWYDQFKEAQGDLVIRFYEDAACTIPYTLSSDLTVQVRYAYEESLNFSLTAWSSQVDPYVAPSGYSYYSIGGRSLYSHHADRWPYPYTTLYQTNHDHYYSVEDPGDGSYHPLPTVTH